MSIGFTFSAESRDMARERKTLQTMSEADECSFHVYEQDADDPVVYHFQFCTAGDIYLHFKDGTITVECQTNVAGPGFHAYAVEFLEKFANQCQLDFEIDDDAEYFDNRDFDLLKTDHFHKWLAKIISVVLEEIVKKDDATDWKISWPVDAYSPESISRTVITSMGRFHFDQLQKVGTSELPIEVFAKEFFIWNERDRDARFYRNEALTKLWTDCYFMLSDRTQTDADINGQIIELLEKSAAYDPALPFPKREYLELCELHGVKGIPVDQLPAWTLFDKIGYRRETISHTVGNLHIPLPGYFIDEMDEDGFIFYDGVENNWHTLRISAFNMSDDVPKDMLDFAPQLFSDVVETPIIVTKGNLRAKAAFKGRIEENDEAYYHVISQIFTGNQQTLITFSFQNESEKEWAYSVVQSMTGGSSSTP
ncbi:MAG: hypothetical protein FWD31_14570 [Planctomycetaceae bacterium]|nr:hypothetical protein [Planctomycetaceae bacterium]